MKTFILALFIISTLYTQTIPEASKIPLKKLNELSPLLGTWSMVMESTYDNGNTWHKSDPIKVEVKSRLKGLSISEMPLEIAKDGFNLETFITFDQYRKVYRKAVIDDTWGIMDIYEGNIENGKLILTNLKSETFFPITEKISRGFKLIIELKSNKRIMEILKTDDLGKTWQPAFKSIYTKIN